MTDFLELKQPQQNTSNPDDSSYMKWYVETREPHPDSGMPQYLHEDNRISPCFYHVSKNGFVSGFWDTHYDASVARATYYVGHGEIPLIVDYGVSGVSPLVIISRPLFDD